MSGQSVNNIGEGVKRDKEGWGGWDEYAYPIIKGATLACYLQGGIYLYLSLDCYLSFINLY